MRYFQILFILLSLLQCKNSEKNNIFYLNEDWNYRKGFDIDWLSNPQKDSNWKKITLPTNLSKELDLGSYNGYITLQKEIPESLNTHLKNGRPLAINAGRVLDVSYFYFNKALIGQLGVSTPYESGAMRPFIKDIPFNDLNLDGKNTVTIVLYGNGKYPLQFMDTIEIGESDSIYVSYTRKEIFSFFFLTIYLVVGLYHILLAYKRKKDIYNFYFGFFCLFASIYWFIANTSTRDVLFQNHVALHRKLEHSILFTLVPSLFLFLVQFFDKQYTKFSKGLAIFSAILILLTLLFPLPVMRFCTALWQISAVTAGPYMVYYLIKQIRKGNKDGMYLIIGLTIFILCVILDIASSRNIIHLPQIANFAFLFFVMGIATILANRFMHVTNEVEILNAELEKKVEDRTKKLQLSLTETQALKEQQDGDYFLTSLLIDPLSGNFIQKKVTDFKIETLVHQKKKFEFKKKKSEIGGDICVVDEIQLLGITYTVFLNGDAMGKSIQGAGGCLVLGTVFKSILERNHTFAATRNLPPELWMKESFRELQNVFVSFNGTMLISAMFGIIDNRNGTMYYINAEHPISVLYRDGHASFIDTKTDRYKIGFELKNNPLNINILSLHRGDSLISGSDGRDDILIIDENTGKQVMNHDESLFLKTLEDAKADLKQIETLLSKKGEFTDDFSLLKITYLNNEVEENLVPTDKIEKQLNEAYQHYLNGARLVSISQYEKLFKTIKDPDLMFEVANIFIDKKEYSFAGPILDIYINAYPANSNMIYIGSFIKKKNREYEQAAVLGERYRLRDPLNVKNLVNLADIYRYLNRKEKSKKLLERALKIEPENKQAHKLLESLEENNFS